MGPRIIAASNNLNLKEAYYSKLSTSFSAYVLSFVAGSRAPDLFMPACDPPKAESFSVRESLTGRQGWFILGVSWLDRKKGVIRIIIYESHNWVKKKPSKIQCRLLRKKIRISKLLQHFKHLNKENRTKRVEILVILSSKVVEVVIVSRLLTAVNETRTQAGKGDQWVCIRALQPPYSLSLMAAWENS